MRKAEEIAADVFNQYAFSMNEREAMIKVINHAREECLEEAAEKAEAWCYAEGGEPEYGVDKQSILNLIKELK